MDINEVGKGPLGRTEGSKEKAVLTLRVLGLPEVFWSSRDLGFKSHLFVSHRCLGW